MKNLFLIALLFSLFQGCIPTTPIPLPDLDPNTGDGSEMLLIDINDVISINTGGTADYQFEGFLKEYHINGDGIVDLELKTVANGKVMLTFNGQFAREVGPWATGLFDIYDTWTPIYLPANGLLGETC